MQWIQQRLAIVIAIPLFCLTLFIGCRPSQESSKPDPVSAQSPAVPPSPDLSPANSRKQRLETASRLVQTAKMDQAYDVIRNLLIENPDDLQANTLMLRVMMHRNDAEAAVMLLDRMMLLSPDRCDDFDAHAASLLAQAGDSQAAITRLGKLLKKSPAFDEARRMLAKILTQQGYSFDANEQVRMLIGHHRLNRDELVGLIFPDRSWNDHQKSRDPAVNSIEPKTDAMRRAVAERISGDPRAAIATLQSSDLLNGNPDLAAAALYGRTLADAQMIDSLQAWVAQAPAECERYPDYWIASGVLARRTNKQAAIECFAKAIKREPGSLDAHYGMIQSLEEDGQTELAEKFRQRSYALDNIAKDVKILRESSSPSAQSFVDVATQLMNVGRPLEAIAWQEFAIAQFSPQSEKLNSIPQYKKQVLSHFSTGRDESLLLCGWEDSKEDAAQTWLAEVRTRDPVKISNIKPSQLPPIDAELPLVDPRFVNVAEQVGLSFRYLNAETPVEREFLIFQAFGGGVACIDFDRDGAVDFYFGQAGTTPPDGISEYSNALYRNLGGEFSDQVSQAGADDLGYTVGVSSGDWNQDGFADLLIGTLGRNRLLINQGDGTFQQHHDPALGSEAAYTSSLAIADMTGDGLPDIVEINYLDDPAIYQPIEYGADGKPINLPGPLQFQPAMDRLLVSIGDGAMSAEPLGDQGKEAFSTGLALLITDLDGNPGNEVFVANDLRANQLWVRSASQSGLSQWSDAAVILGAAYGSSGKPMACMGIAAADFDQNGRIDLHVSNFENEWSNQYMQTFSGTFEDSTVTYGLDVITRKMLGFGTQAIDYDNNTVWDLVVGNGHIEDLTDKGSLFAMPTQLLVGRQNGFIQQAVSGDDAYWKANHFTRALAKCDFNRDGRVDFVATDLKRDAVLLQNETSTINHWIQLECVGTISERDAVGARLTIEFGSRQVVQVVQTGDGYLSKNESALFVGMGTSKSVERVRVQWPSGAESVYENLSCDKRWLLVEEASEAWLLW